MKKFMALVLMAIMLVTLAASALAVTPFEFRASCTDTNAISYDNKREHQASKGINDHKIYVRHWVTGGSDQYTNLFKARKITASGVENGVNCGSKWATVGLNVPIQSNSIVSGFLYTMAGRGNTNHYDYDGVATVTLHGNFYPDLE